MLTMYDAYTVINEVITDYLKNEPVAKTVVLHDVGFRDIFKLYAILPKEKTDLFLPGEIGYENVTIIYKGSPIFNIIIHSEACIDYQWKVKQLDLTDRKN